MEGEIQFVGYIDQHDKLQAMLTLKKRKNVEIGLDQITGITDGFRAGIQVVPDRQHNGQHLVWNHMHYKSCVVVAGKPHVRSTRGTKWE